jgi:hypothetical protein
MVADKICKFGEHIFTINVFDGNHGSWLFISCNNKTIFEQPGFGTDDEALSFGERYVHAFIFHESLGMLKGT